MTSPDLVIENKNRLQSLWRRVYEPRFVTAIMFVWYVIAATVAIYSFFNPPSSLAGQFGSTAMKALLGLLAGGSIIGLIAVLPGWYFMERLALVANFIAGGLYLSIVLGLHFQMPTGNRLLQALMILGVMINSCVIRWYRIKDRPYRAAYDVKD